MNYQNHKEITKIIELNKEQIKWWRNTLTKNRKNIIKKPQDYIDTYFYENKPNVSIGFNVSKHIEEIREKSWILYVNEEVEFYRVVIEILLKEKNLEKILLDIIEDQNINSILKVENNNQMLNVLKNIVGDYTSRIFPYFYELSKSTTQSRRCRAGYFFETIISNLMYYFSYPYQQQQSLSAKLFKQKGLGKIVDGIIPNIESYEKTRQKCIIVTMKTTLRERWQEVVEELNRTNVPSIYLLTLDKEIKINLLNTLKNHNITLVVYEDIKEKFFQQENIISFDRFFYNEIPHSLKWWTYEKL